ncbi:hypothetical protein CKA32_005750 [Geitlerinema sp. FC II]|nr:hypothetical protein CKA32_005750 [Geitlerinema sp. FC II]
MFLKTGGRQLSRKICNRKSTYGAQLMLRFGLKVTAICVFIRVNDIGLAFWDSSKYKTATAKTPRSKTRGLLLRQLANEVDRILKDEFLYICVNKYCFL